MRVIAIILISLLFLFVIGCSLGIFQAYCLYTSPLIPASIINEKAKPYIIDETMYLIAMMISVFLYSRKKYLISVIVAGTCVFINLISRVL